MINLDLIVHPHAGKDALISRPSKGAHLPPAMQTVGRKRLDAEALEAPCEA